MEGGSEGEPGNGIEVEAGRCGEGEEGSEEEEDGARGRSGEFES